MGLGHPRLPVRRPTPNNGRFFTVHRVFPRHTFPVIRGLDPRTPRGTGRRAAWMNRLTVHGLFPRYFHPPPHQRQPEIRGTAGSESTGR